MDTPPGQTVAVLGASGFIGSHLTRRMSRAGIPTRAIVRRPMTEVPIADQRVVQNFRDSAALSAALHGCGQIVHLADEAGRFQNETNKAPIAHALAQARDALNARLLFASSIYARLDEENQSTEYGANKRNQEQLLLASGKAIGLRLPPIYGPGCGGSFAMLKRAMERGLPLPFGLASAPRSFLSIQNLCDLILVILRAPTWDNNTQTLYEPEDEVRISTRDLTKALASFHGRRACLVPVPRMLCDLVASPLGKDALVSGAFDPLAARDNAALASDFGWHPIGGLPETLYHRGGGQSSL